MLRCVRTALSPSRPENLLWSDNALHSALQTRVEMSVRASRGDRRRRPTWSREETTVVCFCPPTHAHTPPSLLLRYRGVVHERRGGSPEKTDATLFSFSFER